MVARVPGRFAAAAGLLLLVAGAPFVGACNTTTTPSYPQPDFQTAPGQPFVLRAGDLALVFGSGEFLYVSVQGVGADTRCPESATCDEPGFLELRLELETSEQQGAITLSVSDGEEAVGTYRAFEIRVLDMEPPGREAQILPTEYSFLMVVNQR